MPGESQLTAGHHSASLVVKAIAVGVVATAALCGAVRGAHPHAGHSGSGRPLPGSVDASLIPNYVRIGPALATGGLPTDAGLRRLRGLGFRIVVDLRAEAEGIAAERAAVTEAGLRYTRGRTYAAAEAGGRRIGLQSPAMMAAVRRVLHLLLDEPQSGRGAGAIRAAQGT